MRDTKAVVSAWLYLSRFIITGDFSEDGAHPSGHERDVRDELFASIRVQSVSDSCRHLKVFRACEALQLFGMIGVAGEEEDLVIFGEGSDGVDGGAAAGGV